jgi:hypothetical protein
MDDSSPSLYENHGRNVRQRRWIYDGEEQRGAAEMGKRNVGSGRRKTTPSNSYFRAPYSVRLGRLMNA